MLANDFSGEKKIRISRVFDYRKNEIIYKFMFFICTSISNINTRDLYDT